MRQHHANCDEMEASPRDDAGPVSNEGSDENAHEEPFDRAAEERLRKVEGLQTVDVEDEQDAGDLQRDERYESLPKRRAIERVDRALLFDYRPSRCTLRT